MLHAELSRPVAAIRVIRKSPSIGAEIEGVDFSRPVPEAVANAIHEALMEYKVVYFRNADMSPEQQVAFGRHFGELTVHPFSPHLEHLPEVMVLDNKEDNPVFATDNWHSDETFRVEPPMGSILRCVRAPQAGGDTLWADMCAAYDGLSDKMRNFVSGLEAIHDFKPFRHKFDGLPVQERYRKLAEMEERLPNPTHPMVRTHPVTGKKALFVNEHFTIGIKGMRDDEARAPRFPLRAGAHPGVPVPLPLGAQLDGVLGQPADSALRHQRLLPESQNHAPSHDPRRQAGLTKANTMTIKRALGVIALVAGCCTGLQAFAQPAYPTRPVRLIAAFPPGGFIDLVARTLAQGYTQAWGQPVTVENRPAVAGNIAAEAVARSAPDGYTALVTATPFAVNASLYKRLPYDPVRDFVPVTMAGFTPLVLAVNANVPAQTVQELIRLARSKPGKINYGSAGNGTLQHLTMELFKRRAGVDIFHVPYKGSPPAMADLLGGTVSVMMGDMATLLPQIQAGKIRALAITSKSSAAGVQQVPTFAEAGLPGLDANVWVGVLVPANTPKAVIQALSSQATRILNEPATRDRLAAAAVQAVGTTPDEFAGYLKSEIERWGQVVHDANIRID